MKTFLLSFLMALSLFINAQWVPINTGLTDLNVNAIAASGSTIYAGTQGGGAFRSTDAGNTWNPINTGLTATCNINAFLVTGTYIFAGTDGLGAFISSNYGNTWTPTNTGLASLDISCFNALGGNIFAGTYSAGIFVTSDNGNTWSAVNNGLTNLNVWSLESLASTLLAGTQGNGIFSSTNNGTSWTVSATTISNKWPRAIAVTGSTVLAGLDNGTAGGVYISTDNGTTWSPSNTGLSGVSLSVFTFCLNGTDIFLGTAAGVFYSNDNGNSWTSIGLTNELTTSLVINGGNLYAGTFTGGIYRQSLNQIIGINENNISNTDFAVYPNPASEQLYIKGTANNDILHVRVSDVEDNTLYHGYISMCTGICALPIELSNGIYFIEMKNRDQESSVKKFIVAK